MTDDTQKVNVVHEHNREKCTCCNRTDDVLGRIADMLIQVSENQRALLNLIVETKKFREEAEARFKERMNPTKRVN